MARAHALTFHDASAAHDVSAAGDPARTALGLAILLALLLGAAVSFAAHGDPQASPEEIAQLGD